MLRWARRLRRFLFEVCPARTGLYTRKLSDNNRLVTTAAREDPTEKRSNVCSCDDRTRRDNAETT
jgi:hypothetical protein